MRKRELLKELEWRLTADPKFVSEVIIVVVKAAKAHKGLREMMTSRKSYIEHIADIAERGVKRWSGQK